MKAPVLRLHADGVPPAGWSGALADEDLPLLVPSLLIFEAIFRTCFCGGVFRPSTTLTADVDGGASADECAREEPKDVYEERSHREKADEGPSLQSYSCVMSVSRPSSGGISVACHIGMSAHVPLGTPCNLYVAVTHASELIVYMLYAMFA